MSVIGTVTEEGKVLLPPEVQLPAGTRVRVETVDSADEAGSVWDWLRKFDGCAKGLPSDLAENHDHYLHGTPKRR